MDPAFREEIKKALGVAAAGSGDEVSRHIVSSLPPSHTHKHTHTHTHTHMQCSPLTE